MRKTILAIATIVTLTVGNGFAQRYRHEVPAMNNSRGDNAVEEYQINKLDEIVKLVNIKSGDGHSTFMGQKLFTCLLPNYAAASLRFPSIPAAGACDPDPARA